jgi:hypothetical protein
VRERAVWLRQNDLLSNRHRAATFLDCGAADLKRDVLQIRHQKSDAPHRSDGELSGFDKTVAT